MVAETFFDLVHNHVRFELRSSTIYSHRFPLAFLQALRSEAQEAKLMKWMSELWPVLVGALAAAPRSPVLRDLLGAMMWPSSVFALEGFVAAFETGFSGFPTDFKQELEQVSKVFAFSVPCEKAHGHILDAQRQSKNKQLGRHAKCIGSSLLESWMRTTANPCPLPCITERNGPR